MTGVLRFIGVVNAAIWFGSAIFVIVAVPVFFTPEAKQIFPGVYYGLAAQMIIGRFITLQYWCGSIAMLHLLVERYYTGRVVERLTTILLTVMFALTLVAGLWIQPKLKAWHITIHRGQTVEQQQEAKKLFGFWHGMSQVGNLFVACGLLFYLWRMTSPDHPSRLPGYRKVSVGWQ